MQRRLLFLALLSATFTAKSVCAQDDLNDQLEKMTKDAAKKAGPSVVQIETRGGTDIVVAGPKGQTFRKALGPTTGVIVDANGYIISSAFNFLNNPTTILVQLPGKSEPIIAARVATDKSRMLTLLKVDAKGLPVPAIVPKKELKEGQWAIALGRALDLKSDKAPAVCVGIISALNRVWGKAIQTDAKISPINYGGPIVDISGRVQGILIPASPNGSDETAGFEWYDSGIGFAIPMEDVMAILPLLMKGKDLQKGVLGINMKSQDIYSVAPEIGAVQKGSAAAKAGLKPGDIIVEIDGHPVIRMAQVQHVLGVKYEGDKIGLKYKRGKDTVDVKDMVLAGANIAVAQPFLGTLPLRDDPKLGVEIRYVFENSPAAKLGLKAGDRIVKYGTDDKNIILFTGQKRGRTQFFEWLDTQSPDSEIKLEVKPKGADKANLMSVTLGYLPGALPGIPASIPDKLPQPASAKKALAELELSDPKLKGPKAAEENRPKAETGLLERTTPDGAHKYWLWVDDDYDPNVANAMIVWLHPPDKNKRDDFDAFADLWLEYCRENHIIIVMPVNQGSWIPSDADYVVAAARETMKHYTIDTRRVVAHGMAVGGQMALYLGFNHRDLFRGVATVGATATQMKDNVANQRLSFYLAAGDLDPLVKTIAESRLKLAERRFPAFYREMPQRGREYLEAKHIHEMFRWIDSLDQQ
jgi:S1-C subfamily serine protease